MMKMNVSMTRYQHVIVGFRDRDNTDGMLVMMKCLSDMLGLSMHM